MSALRDRLADQGIRLLNHAVGNHKGTCPRCSHTRRDKRDPCLSITIEDDHAIWNCHHCQWGGRVNERSREPLRRRAPPTEPVKPTARPGDLSPEVSRWFRKKRGISEAVLRRNGVGAGPAYIPAAGAEVPCIWFPYRRGGEVVNFKFRDGQKRFAQVKGAEKVFFGLDDIAGCEEAIIVEGEMDKLAFEEAGYLNVISVPDGAPAKVKDGAVDPEDDAKFEYVWNCRDELAPLKKIILAVDGDAAGRALEEELARRLGRERCWRVAWPEINDVACKDANEVLLQHGPEILREVIEQAQPFPIASLFGVEAFESETLELYRHGPKRTFSTGFPALDECYRIREGELTIATGMTGSGKSEVIDAIMVNLAERYGWRFAVCSFENPPAEHIAKLAEKRLRMPFREGPTPRMGESDLRGAMDWLRDHFYFVRAEDESPTVDWILEKARAAVMRHGVRGLVIDPYNEVDHRRPPNLTETEYVSAILSKIKRFAQGHGVHVWFVAHPAKMRRDDGGKIPTPTLYDISGSANFANKADVGLVVNRDWRPGANMVEVHVKKVRFKATGKVGVVTLQYDRATGCYSEAA